MGTLRTEKMFQALAIGISAFLAIAQARDTSYCPDGWDLIQGHTADSINCILLGGLEERVTKKDAELICGGHDGWLVEIQAEHGGHHGNHKNRDIVKLISAKQGQNNIGTPGYNFRDQWWIGATCQGPHGDHNQGHWTWDHCGSDVQWFDFYDDEPNNWHSRNRRTLSAVSEGGQVSEARIVELIRDLLMFPIKQNTGFHPAFCRENVDWI